MKLFGTDGIRGDSSKFPFDNVTLEIIGKSIAETVLGTGSGILIIRDTRQSGKRIQEELAKGFLNVGVSPIFGGIMPTPAASFLARRSNYLAAVVISASHNPYFDNGIKIFNSKGLKLAGHLEAKIENKVHKYICLKKIIPTKNIKVKENSKLLKIYEKFVIGSFSGKTLDGKTIVVDCANGASYECAPHVLKKLGAKVIALNVSPNGENINSNCGTLYPEHVVKIVKESRAFCGFAFDGDADRLICIDESGILRDGDYFLASMALWLKSNNKLKNNILVSTFMANMGLLDAMKMENIRVVFAKIGDKHVINNMRKHKASFGGESSGHFIFKDVLATGDGLIGAVMLLSALCSENKTMSEFMNVLEKFPQIFINKRVTKKVPFEKLSKSCKLIERYEKSLGTSGRIIVRYSGTENILRVMVEGKNIGEVKLAAGNIANSLEEEIEFYN
jgi:phosphoglucosamine mutase